VVEDVTPDDVTNGLAFDIHLAVDGVKQMATEFGAGEVTVTVPLGKLEVPEGKTARVYYVTDENGQAMLTDMKGKHDREGNEVEFTTNHFSTYVILVEECLAHEYDTDGSCTICGHDNLPDIIYNKSEGTVVLADVPESVTQVVISVNVGDKVLYCTFGSIIEPVRIPASVLRQADCIRVFYLDGRFAPVLMNGNLMMK
jgi:hypothetical protein